MSFAGQFLRLPPAAKTVRVFGESTELPATKAGFALPPAQGRLLLEVPDFFHD